MDFIDIWCFALMKTQQNKNRQLEQHMKTHKIPRKVGVGGLICPVHVGKY